MATSKPLALTTSCFYRRANILSLRRSSEGAVVGKFAGKKIHRAIVPGIQSILDGVGLGRGGALQAV